MKSFAVTGATPGETTPWSACTQKKIARALRGHSALGQERFCEAWLAMRMEWQQVIERETRQALVESWNAYLARIAPAMVRRGQILQLHGMLIFIGDYPAEVDHARIAAAVARELGPAGERLYRQVVDDFIASTR